MAPTRLWDSPIVYSRRLVCCTVCVTQADVHGGCQGSAVVEWDWQPLACRRVRVRTQVLVPGSSSSMVPWVFEIFIYHL
jgi:hypothetical protein